MRLFGCCLLFLCVAPLCGQFAGCLSPHFNCIIDRVSGQHFDNGTLLTQTTEHVHYDEGRQMMVHEVTGQANSKPIWEMRIFDYPKKILYYITRPGGQEICSKSNLTEPFKKICLPNNTQEIWLKSPLGTEGNMVPTVRFKWEVRNVTTELTYTYFSQPVIQNWYGLRNDDVVRDVPLFETSWYTNITVNDVGPAVFTPPKSCENAVFESKPNLDRQSDRYLRF